jgi:hypothetical protein
MLLIVAFYLIEVLIDKASHFLINHSHRSLVHEYRSFFLILLFLDVSIYKFVVEYHINEVERTKFLKDSIKHYFKTRWIIDFLPLFSVFWYVFDVDNHKAF